MRKTKTVRRKAMRKTRRKRGGEIPPSPNYKFVSTTPGIKPNMFNSLSLTQLENTLETIFNKALLLKDTCNKECLKKICPENKKSIFSLFRKEDPEQNEICSQTKDLINTKSGYDSANFCDNRLIRNNNTKTCSKEYGKNSGTDNECSCSMFLQKLKEFDMAKRQINKEQNRELYEKAETGWKILQNEIPNRPILWKWRVRRGALV